MKRLLGRVLLVLLFGLVINVIVTYTVVLTARSSGRPFYVDASGNILISGLVDDVVARDDAVMICREYCPEWPQWDAPEATEVSLVDYH